MSNQFAEITFESHYVVVKGLESDAVMHYDLTDYMDIISLRGRTDLSPGDRHAIKVWSFSTMYRSSSNLTLTEKLMTEEGQEKLELKLQLIKATEAHAQELEDHLATMKTLSEVRDELMHPLEESIRLREEKIEALSSLLKIASLIRQRSRHMSYNRVLKELWEIINAMEKTHK